VTPAGYDVVVVGLGAAGSAAARELARRGRSVLGLDRFGPEHRLGSSHGESRLIRSLYHEGPGYVPLLRDARSGWSALEREADRELLLETGVVAVGAAQGRLVTGCLATSAEHDLAYRELSAGELRDRFPAFRLPPGRTAILDPAGGVLLARRCLSALRQGARRAGAELRFGSPVLGWYRDGDGLAVETEAGRVRSGALVVAAGGWTADLVEETRLPLTVERQTTHRFPPPAGVPCGPDRFPGFLLEPERGEGTEGGGGSGETLAYGIPDLGRGVKVALHHGGEEADRPEDVRREVDPEEAGKARRAVEPLLPGPGRSPVGSRVCLYTDTPDGDFLIDRLEGEPPVILATGFSGHGFKFAPAVGRVAADLAEGRRAPFDLDPFRLGRRAE